jgi:hypothetical protein
VLTDSQFVFIAIVFDGDNYKVYLNGTEEAGCTTASTSSIIQPKKLRLGADYVGTGLEFYGYVEDFSFCPWARYTGNFSAPVATLPIDSVHWYNYPLDIMYYGTPASWSAVLRVFLGVAYTNAGGVTGVDSFAFKGFFKSSGGITWTLGTPISDNHNIGTNLINCKIYLINLSPEYGYNPGDRVGDVVGLSALATSHAGACSWTRKWMQWRPSAYSVGALLAAGTWGVLTPAKWEVYFEAKRAF